MAVIKPDSGDSFLSPANEQFTFDGLSDAEQARSTVIALAQASALPGQARAQQARVLRSGRESPWRRAQSHRGLPSAWCLPAD